MSPLAFDEKNSKGRVIAEPTKAQMSEYSRDKSRIVYSEALRKLQFKTLLFSNLDVQEDLQFRTRFNHSLELAQLGESAAKLMGLNPDLSSAIALVHDIGHAPFGYTGQAFLNRVSEDIGGFNHYAQALRIADLLESNYLDFPGLNLTYEVRESLYYRALEKISSNNQQFNDIKEKINFNDSQPSLEAQLIEKLDRIAFMHSDLEDAILKGLVKLEEVVSISDVILKQIVAFQQAKKIDGQTKKEKLVKNLTSKLINISILDLVENSLSVLRDAGIKTGIEAKSAEHRLIKHSEDFAEHYIEKLYNFLIDRVYSNAEIESIRMQEGLILEKVYNEVLNKPKLLSLSSPDNRKIVDEIALLTDRDVLKVWHKLNSHKAKAVYKK